MTETFESKEFYPSFGTIIFEVAIGGGVIFMLVCLVLTTHWMALVIVLPLILLIIGVVGVDVTESILITADDISRGSFWSVDIIPLNEILRISKGGGGRSNTLLLIETEQESFRWGDGLTDEQLDEAIEFAMKQLLIYYPHRYNFVTMVKLPNS